MTTTILCIGDLVTFAGYKGDTTQRTIRVEKVSPTLVTGYKPADDTYRSYKPALMGAITRLEPAAVAGY